MCSSVPSGLQCHGWDQYPAIHYGICPQILCEAAEEARRDPTDTACRNRFHSRAQWQGLEQIRNAQEDRGHYLIAGESPQSHRGLWQQTIGRCQTVTLVSFSWVVLSPLRRDERIRDFKYRLCAPDLVMIERGGPTCTVKCIQMFTRLDCLLARAQTLRYYLFLACYVDSLFPL